MPTCASCAAICPDASRFCPACGARLGAAHGAAIERKVVTTLFADLVGFTALGERADPEDIDGALRSYYEMARTIIERFGGTVEKFIGDAVVGLFGVPAAHEDDAERAVRAALEIVAHMSDLPPVAGEPLRVRAGVNTGPALVRLHVLPSSGEGILVGDAVNTAARLLTAAPPMGVVVGAATHELSARAIEYEELPALVAKGKSRPVQTWLARGAVARRGTAFGQPAVTSMVGREVELAVLNGLFDKARASSTPQYALVVGEAGMGKSRLVHEFGQMLDRRPGLMCAWRQGSCPPYGDGLAFRALSDIVRLQAGILESDADDVVARKLADAPGMADCEPSVIERLRPLVGLPAPQAPRHENYSAWLRFLERVVDGRPTVIVLEDLHWASDQTLAFLGHLVKEAPDVPLLLIGTARPEFLDAHPALDQYQELVPRVDLKALSPRETARLVDELWKGEGAPPAVDAVLARCGGNPLYAEELVRYYDGTPATERESSVAPESLKNLIAARLDALPPTHKTVIGDAAVVGDVFWPGAVSALLEAESPPAGAVLEDLEERQLVRRRSSALDGETEYEFWHSLTREVAYERLPRGVKAAKHAGVARWIESASSGRARDWAQNLSYHYSTALDLARAAGDTALADDLLGPAVRSLRAAGDHALALDIGVARRAFARAVELAPPDDPERARIMSTWAEALCHDGRFEEATAALREAALQLKAMGDLAGAAVASRRAAILQSNVTGRSDEELLVDSGQLEHPAPSPEAVRGLEERASSAVWMSLELAISLADQAIEMCSDLGLPEPLDALGQRGWATAVLGDERGLDDIRAAIRLAKGRDYEHKQCGLYYNLAEVLSVHDGPEEALAARRDGLRLAVKRRDVWAEGYCREGEFGDLVWSGAWNQAREALPGVERFLVDHEMTLDLERVHTTAALLHLWSGQVMAARSLAEEAAAGSRASLDPGMRVAGLAGLAVVSEAIGEREQALRLLEDILQLPSIALVHPDHVLRLPALIRAAVALARPDLAERLTSRLPRDRAYDAATLTTLKALLAGAEGSRGEEARAWTAAADAWRALGVPYEEGLALLDCARCLRAPAHEPDGVMLLTAALAIFSELGARPAAAEAKAMLRA